MDEDSLAALPSFSRCHVGSTIFLSAPSVKFCLGGKPRSYRDSKPIALDAGSYLKSKNPNIEVTVGNLETGMIDVIRNPPVTVRR